MIVFVLIEFLVGKKNGLQLQSIIYYDFNKLH